MLPATARLRRRDDFTTVFRSGRRIARGPLVLHVLRELPPDPSLPVHAPGGGSTPPSPTGRVGFVISGKVGNAVARNRLRRRLREVLRARLDRVSPGGALVVRALPGAAELSYGELVAVIDGALPAGDGRR